MTARSSAAVLHALTLRIRSRSFNDMVDSLISDCIFKATQVYDTYDMTFNLFCAFVLFVIICCFKSFSSINLRVKITHCAIFTTVGIFTDDLYFQI